MADLKPPLIGYSLWLEAEEKEQAFLQTLVDDLARRHGTRRFGAHLTLLGLLEKTENDLEYIRRSSEDIAKNTAMLTTEIIGIGIRDMYFQSVFLPVSPSPELLRLNDAARKYFGHSGDAPYMPHWSGIYGDLGVATRHEVASSILFILRFPFTVPITNLALVDVKGYPDEWTVKERYPFSF